MRRLLIHGVNGFFMVIILIGIPAITSARFGNLLLSSAPKAQMLTLWGLTLAAVGDAVAALGLLRGRKERQLCWTWAATFGVLLLIEYLFVRGYFNFDWLKEVLQWVQRRF